jgi:hypothetical protein
MEQGTSCGSLTMRESFALNQFAIDAGKQQVKIQFSPTQVNQVSISLLIFLCEQNLM